MRFVVTGGYGFIGSHVCDLLSKHGHRFTVLDAETAAAVNREHVQALDGCRRYKGAERVEDPAAWDIDDGYDGVIHLAAESHVDRSIGMDPTTLATISPAARATDLFLRSNVIGTTYALDFAHRHEIPIVHVSTDEVYGDAVTPATFNAIDIGALEPWVIKPNIETDSRHASSPYSASKVAAEHVVESWVRTFGVDARIVRPTNAFGPRQTRDKLIPVAVSHLLAGKPAPLYAGGGQIRQWLHVEDLARGILAAFEKGKIGGVYNLGGPDDNLLRNRDLVRLLAESVVEKHGGDCDSYYVTVGDRPGHDLAYRVNSNLARVVLRWNPVLTVKDRRAEIVDFYDD